MGVNVKHTIPFWKKILSHVFEFKLEQIHSEKNADLEVMLSKGQIKLVSQHAIYSYGNLYTNFYEVFRLLNIQDQNIKSCLILGLGTGSIIQMLEHKFKLNSSFTAVEFDAEVIQLFEKYVKHTLQSPIRCIQSDALEYISNDKSKYDLICMDIFVDAKVPEQFESKDFLQALLQHLSKDGILIYNRLAELQHDKDLNVNFEQTFQSAYPQFRCIKLEHNWMYLITKEPSI